MRFLLLLSVLPALAGCDLPPPTHEALYPPDAAQLSEFYIITHDRYNPWPFHPVDSDMLNR